MKPVAAQPKAVRPRGSRNSPTTARRRLRIMISALIGSMLTASRPMPTIMAAAITPWKVFASAGLHASPAGRFRAPSFGLADRDGRKTDCVTEGWPR